MKTASNDGAGCDKSAVKTASNEGSSCSKTAAKAAYDATLAESGCEKTAKAAYVNALAEQHLRQGLRRLALLARPPPRPPTTRSSPTPAARRPPPAPPATPWPRPPTTRPIEKTSCAKTSQAAYDTAMQASADLGSRRQDRFVSSASQNTIKPGLMPGLFCVRCWMLDAEHRRVEPRGRKGSQEVRRNHVAKTRRRREDIAFESGRAASDLRAVRTSWWRVLRDRQWPIWRS